MPKSKKVKDGATYWAPQGADGTFNVRNARDTLAEAEYIMLYYALDHVSEVRIVPVTPEKKKK